MARIKFNGAFVAGAVILLVIGLAVLGTEIFGESWNRGGLRLPTGNGTPAISLGERHGLILASDGSLWSWGADFLHWPVLGLGNLANRSTTLRRIGNDTNWAGISASADRNLAVKTDGTLWAW